jgi:phage host-nuclease inhibitor protein Gam
VVEMAESTKGFKIDDDLKRKINSTIQASGMNDKEWIEAVTNLWVMQDIKNGMPDYRKDIGELELHTKRINDLFTNMIQQTAFEKDEIQRKVEDLKESKNQIIEQCQLEISDLKKQVQLAVEEVDRYKTMKDEAERLVRKMEEAGENNKLLIQEYKEKNDTLTGLVNDFRQGYEESKALEEEVNRLNLLTEKLQGDLQKEKEALDSLNEIHKEVIRQTEERQKTEVERIIERKEIEKERELLQIRTQYQDKLQKANEEYTAKIQSLYEQIEHLRKEQK